MKQNRKKSYLPIQYITNPVFIGNTAYGQQIAYKKHIKRED